MNSDEKIMSPLFKLMFKINSKLSYKQITLCMFSKADPLIFFKFCMIYTWEENIEILFKDIIFNKGKNSGYNSNKFLTIKKFYRDDLNELKITLNKMVADCLLSSHKLKNGNYVYKLIENEDK